MLLKEPNKKVSAVNQYFDHVYVLNLENRTGRKMEMMQKLAKLNIRVSFFPAVNGYNFRNRLEYETYLQQPLGSDGASEEVVMNRKLIENVGAWGCLKSYYHILQDAKKNGYQRILCLEDDALFHKDFENKFKKAIQAIPKNWKFLYLGASQRNWGIPGGLNYPDKNKAVFDPNASFYLPKKTNGTFALGIDLSVYGLMLQEIIKMKSPIDNGPVQSVINDYQEQCFVLTPNLIIADVTDSDIRGKRNQVELSKKLKWKLEEYDFPSQKENIPQSNKDSKLFTMMEKNYRHYKNILIENHKALFFIIPKTGCTSLKVQLVKPLGMKQSENIHSFIHQLEHYNFPFSNYDELTTTYKEYFKFAMVRNPWDRLVSCFKDKIRTADYNETGFKNGVAIPLQRFGASFYGGMTFEAFIDVVCELPDAIADDHFRSQFYQLISSEGELLINYIGRFETMKESLLEINQKTRLQFISSIHLNKSGSVKPYQDYYNKELIEKVRKRYFADIHLLQYQFEPNKTLPIGRIDEHWKEHFSKSNLLLPFIEEKNRALNIEIAKLWTQNNTLIKKLNTFKKNQNVRLTNQKKNYEHQIKKMQDSTSWRITAPLRKLASIITLGKINNKPIK